MPASKQASSPATPDPEAVKSFKELFWKARATHRKRGRLADREDPVHQLALTFAGKQPWPWAAPLLTALFLAYHEDDQEALDVLAGIETPDAFAGERYFVQGLAYHGLNSWDTALECYRKALESPGFDLPGNVWFNMGGAHYGKKEFDAALECNRKALESTGFDSVGDAWFNMGVVNGDKDESDAALECYHNALASPGFDTPGDAWNNIGIVHEEIKEFGLALEC